MDDTWPAAFRAWHDWYALVGTSAATLVALLFVVVSLSPRVIAKGADTAGRAFLTPTATLFVVSLIASLVMVSPGLPAPLLAAMLCVGGVGGALNLIVVDVHGQWKKSRLGIDDWCWYLGMPFLGFVLYVAAAMVVLLHPSIGLTIEGVVSAAFLIIGIRNAWDTSLWIAGETSKGDVD